MMMVRWMLFVAGILVCRPGSASEINPAVQHGHYAEISLLAVSPGGQTIASSGGDRQIIFWDLKTGMQLKKKSVDFLVTDIVFASEKDLLIRAENKHYVLDAARNEISEYTNPFPRDKDAGIRAIRNNMVYKVEGPVISLIKDNNVIRSHTSQYFDEGFTSVTTHEKCGFIFASSLDGLIYVYDSGTLKFIRTLKGHNSAVHSVIISNDAKLLYSAGKDRSIIEWDISSFKMKRRFHSHSFRITSVAFDKDGSQLFFGNELGQLKIFNMQSYSQELLSIAVSDYPVNRILQHPVNDSALLILSLENKIREFSIPDHRIKTFGKYHSLSLRFMYQNIFQNVLGFYAEPAFADYMLDADPGRRIYVYHATENSNKLRRKLVVKNTVNGRSRRIRFTMNYLDDVEVINDSLFGVIQSRQVVTDESFSFILWKLKNRKLTYSYIDIGPSHAIESYKGKYVFSLSGNEIRILDIESMKFRSVPLAGKSANEFWIINDICFVSDLSNDITAYRISAEGDLAEIKVFHGHESVITSVAVHPSGKMLVSSSGDATIRFWDMQSGKHLATLIPVDDHDFIIVSSSGEYQITKNAFRTFGFAKGLDFFYPDQFDLRYNQPHKVLAAIGTASVEQIILLEKAYLKRLKRMGFSEETLSSEVTLPEVKITGRGSEMENRLPLVIEATDPHYALDRINVYVNDVPVYGSSGIDLRKNNSKEWKSNISVPLMQGNNKIEISVLNSAGIESLRQTDNYFNEATGKPDLYLVSVGVSEYMDKRYNLTYAAKDAQDLAGIFKNGRGIFGNVHSFIFKNDAVKKENILSVKEKLAEAKANDIVMIFVAGHGVLDKEFNYYIATHDMDFDDPGSAGISYDELEGMMDGLAAIRKILIIDACHSGEIDKEEVEELTAQNLSSGNVKFRAAGAGIRKKEHGLKTSSELMSELFADLRKGTGATVISSAGGVEYAMESDEWKNGLFTYCFLTGLTHKKADMNKDGVVMLSEIQSYLRTTVSKLSNGMQQPVSRAENISLDFPLW